MEKEDKLDVKLKKKAEELFCMALKKESLNVIYHKVGKVLIDWCGIHTVYVHCIIPEPIDLNYIKAHNAFYTKWHQYHIVGNGYGGNYATFKMFVEED